MRKTFTGWHMTAALVGGFGIVVAVNLLMASVALASFGGVVVENSYVASQKFNGWLAEAERASRLGWTARVARTEAGLLEVATTGTPAGLSAAVELRRPLGRRETLHLQLNPVGQGLFLSSEPVPPGRWVVRITLSETNRELRLERPLG